MAIQLKAYKFRLYPTPDQEVLLNKTFGCVRFVWNKLVENFNSWNPDFTPPPLNDKILKDTPEFNFLNEVSAAALQGKKLDFDETKKQYFSKTRKKKIGKPKFKSRKGRQSYKLTGETRFRLDQKNNTIRIEKIGKIPIRLDRIIPEDVNYRSVTISKTPSGKYYASILVKINIEPKRLTGKMVGIDLGLKDLFIFSNGEKVDNPKHFRENQAKLKRAQQHLSRKKKGSARRDRQRIKVARIHEKIMNKRKDLLHKTSNQLVTNYDVICVEDLNVSGMVKNHCLAKAITDASWSSFMIMLEYKCNWYGKTLVKIDRFYPSSKTCGHCGYKLKEIDLDTREWQCPECGTHHDRDINAAINILNKGFTDLCGTELEFTGISKKPVSVESIEYRRGENVSGQLVVPVLDEASRNLLNSEF